ncbi:hypothetical protein AAGG74_18740 [Bacillus mexicanus]|uniref:hypothetical protein n=1 Tax=Bacillus mexicanus TaxID=2834415 RepID=UPI003D1F9031
MAKQQDEKQKKNKKTEQNKNEESKEVENEPQDNDSELNENKNENVDSENQKNDEQQANEQRWLQKILDHPIKVLIKGEAKQDEDCDYETKMVKDIIDPEDDIWFSKQKNKPILKETGTKKLIQATGATFPRIIPIEKQSDAPSKDREQVWIEATVLFPNGEQHEEYGIANRSNCTDSISQANLPIMARKRAMNRAFYRSDYIGLYDVYDENETLDVKDEKYKNEIKQLKQTNYNLNKSNQTLQNELDKTIKKRERLLNQMCKEVKTEDGELVWKINDVQRLTDLSKGTSLVTYIAQLKLQHIHKNKKASSN